MERLFQNKVHPGAVGPESLKSGWADERRALRSLGYGDDYGAGWLLNPAFVIHSRLSGRPASSWSRSSTRIAADLPWWLGSRGPRSPLKGCCPALHPAHHELAWQGDLKNLAQVEMPGSLLRLGGDRLFYGLYLNELVYYLLEAHTPEVQPMPMPVP